MNLSQAKAVVRLLQDAAHPRTCPITGQFYTPDEYAEFGKPSVSIRDYEAERDGDPEMMRVGLWIGVLERDRELFVTDDGVIYVWSTIEIPPEDLDCECVTTGEPDPSACPVHGDAVRELDCYRCVRAIGWEIVDEPHPLREITRHESQRVGGDGVVGVDVPVSARTLPRWRYVVREGNPLRDVLTEYRVEREKAKAPTSIDEVVDTRTLEAKPPWVG